MPACLSSVCRLTSVSLSVFLILFRLKFLFLTPCKIGACILLNLENISRMNLLTTNWSIFCWSFLLVSRFYTQVLHKAIRKDGFIYSAPGEEIKIHLGGRKFFFILGKYENTPTGNKRRVFRLRFISNLVL